MLKSTATSTMPINVTPVAERPLDKLFYYEVQSEVDLFVSLRGLRSVLLAASNTINYETEEYILTGSDMNQLLLVALDLAFQANEHAESWSDNESQALKELKKRAYLLPKRDELWIKCNVAADRRLNEVEKTAAINGMIATIKPVIITRHDGTKSIVKLCNHQVREGWSGESLRDGLTPPVTVEEMAPEEELA